MRYDPRVLLLLALLGLAACSSPPVRAKQGAPAPDFSLDNLDGEPISLSSFAGRPILLNFWATWCKPCLGEIPELESIAEEGAIQVVGVALDEGGAQPVSAFVEEHGMRYPILMGDQSVFRQFDGFGIPHTLLLDSSGLVLKIFRGPVTVAMVKDALDSRE